MFGNPKTQRLTIGSLFSGIGGLELGLEWAGLGPVLWQVEKDPYCLKVLEKHWPGVKRYEDVGTVGSENLERVDLICGGFPCQDISCAGRGAGIKKGTRSGLWYEFTRVISELRPKFVIVENVPALLSRGMGIVCGDLAALGYGAWYDCIPAQAVGAPHRRDRVFIVAYTMQGRCRTGWTRGSAATSKREREPIKSMENDIANSKRNELRHKPRRRSGQKRTDSAEPADDGTQKPMADTHSGSLGWPAIARQEYNHWSAEPDVGRVAHGVSTELDETIRRLGYEQSSDKETFTKIIQHRRRILRILWEHEQSAAPSSRGRCIFNYSSMPGVSHSDTYEGWILGARIEEDQKLRDMWRTICSEPFEETQNLQQGLLEYIRTQERNEKVASSRVHRLRALGNAVVPQVAQVIGEIVKELHHA